LSFVYLAQSQDLHRFAVLWKSVFNEEWDCRVVNVAISEKQIMTSVDYLRKKLEKFSPRGETGKEGIELPGPRVASNE